MMFREQFFPIRFWILGFLTVITIVVAHFIISWKNRKIRKAMNWINGPTGLPFIGNALTLLVPDYKVISVFQKWNREYGSVFRIWLGSRPYIFVADPKLAEIVLTSKTQLRKALDYDFLHPFLGQGLSTLNGPQWSRRRRLISSIFFNFKALHYFLEVFNKQSFALIEKLRQGEAQSGKPFNLHPLMTQCALNIICETAMGRIGTDSEDTEYMKTVHEMCEVLIERIMSPWLRPSLIWTLSPQGRKEKKMKKILHNFIDKIIRQRREEREQQPLQPVDDRYEPRQSFLDILLDSELSDEDIRDETQTFIFGGHDTTASSLSWALFLIASFPDVQRKLELELHSIFGDNRERAVTLDDVHRMKYTEAIIKESLRLYPSAPFYGRYLTSDTFIDEGRIFPAGTSVFISPILLHKNETIFPEADKFWPERFLPENQQEKDPYAFIPFSAGPRNCVGQKFAMMEEKVVISNFLRRFTVYPGQRVEEAKYILELTLKPKDGPLIRVEEKATPAVNGHFLSE